MDGDRPARGNTWLLLAAAVLFSSTAVAQTGNKRLVCWTDDLGRKACGDSLPAQYANKQRTIIDSSGRTVKVIPAAIAPEQRAAAEAQARVDAIAKRAAEQQDAYDRALLATYSRPQELAELRNDRLASIDTTIELSESAARRNAVSVAELRARLPAADSKEKPHPALLKQIESFETALADSQRSLGDMRKARERLCSTFTRDILRFQELKSGGVTFNSPCPAVGSLSQGEAVTNIEGARRFFDRHADLENDFDPALLDNYSDDAVIKLARIGADGKPVIEERKIADYRADQVKALPIAKQKLDTHSYSDIKVEPGTSGRATISGQRTSTLTKASTPFYFVVKSTGNKPSGPEWKIVEAGTEVRQ